MFKKALISLGTLGVIGGSGVGVYYVVEKNKISDAAISSTAKNSSEISTQQISVVNPVPPTDVRTEGNHEPSIQPQSQQQSAQTNLDNAVHKPEVDAAAQVGAGDQLSGVQSDGVQGGSSQAGTSPADDADSLRSPHVEGNALNAEPESDPKDSSDGGDTTKLTDPLTDTTLAEKGNEGSLETGRGEEAGAVRTEGVQNGTEDSGRNGELEAEQTEQQEENAGSEGTRNAAR